jgi:hypothetical protein
MKYSIWRRRLETAKKRPTEITILGWIFIGYAVFIIFWSTIGLVYVQFVRHIIANNLFHIPREFTSLMMLLKYGELTILPTIAVAIFVIIAGIYLLKLHAWARNAMEIVCWIILGCHVGYGIFFIIFWNRLLFHLLMLQRRPAILPFMGPYGVFLALVSIAMNVVPLAVIIYVLRKKTVREACV